MSINTIIFDLEGVIIDSVHLWDKGQEEFLARKGFVYDKDKIKHLLTGSSLADGMKVMQNFYGFQGELENLIQERSEIMRNLFKVELEFIPGFENFYNSIRNNYKMSIGTSLEREFLSVVDKKFGLSNMFGKNIFSVSDIGGLSKPNPAIFLHAAKMVSSLPENCVVIEDSPNGIDAAKKAGMRSIGITTTYASEKLKDANFVVDSFGEISREMIS
jgi:beta-phosphoglucomutase-like phosphatase (HAD superfamily)